ncbi:MAG: T9SS type A sorting domain-containing protein, partial [Saprospiraceae bacterium]
VFFSDASVGINQNNRVRPLPGDYVLWSDNLIRVIVPTVGYHADTLTTNYYAGSGPIWVKVGSSTKKSTEEITVRLAAINRSRNDGGTIPKRKAVHLVGDFGQYQGYTLYYTSAFKAVGGATDAFERALCTLVETDNINFRIREQSEIDPLYLQYACAIDMVNNLPGGVTSSTKALTTRTYVDLCSSGGVVLYSVMRKFDIYFKKSVDWYVDEAVDPNNDWEDHPDLEAFSLHELGHAQLLLHVNQIVDLMWWEIFGAKRTLQAGDIEGGEYIQGISTPNGPNGCSTGIASLTDCGLINSIDGSTSNFGMKVAPNPTSGSITICSETPSNSKIVRLFDSYGRLAFTKLIVASETEIDISQFAPGIYFMTILEGIDDHVTFKIVKK